MASSHLCVLVLKSLTLLQECSLACTEVLRPLLVIPGLHENAVPLFWACGPAPELPVIIRRASSPTKNFINGHHFSSSACSLCALLNKAYHLFPMMSSHCQNACHCISHPVASSCCQNESCSGAHVWYRFLQVGCSPCYQWEKLVELRPNLELIQLRCQANTSFTHVHRQDRQVLPCCYTAKNS